jgi:hypothetical protein
LAFATVSWRSELINNEKTEGSAPLMTTVLLIRRRVSEGIFWDTVECLLRSNVLQEENIATKIMISVGRFIAFFYLKKQIMMLGGSKKFEGPRKERARINNSFLGRNP